MYQSESGLPHHHKVYGQSLADGQALPQNTTWNGSGVRLSGTMGGIEVVVRAKTALSIANTQTITVKLQESDTESSGYTDLETLYTLTASGGNGAIAKGTELKRFIIPTSAKKFIRAQIVTDDAAATGSLDVLPTKLPH